MIVYTVPSEDPTGSDKKLSFGAVNKVSGQKKIDKLGTVRFA